MKTRTNQPIELVSTDDIEHLSDSVLNELKCGDIITKQTGNMKHTYIVSYKEEKHGICLSYFACGYLETISYDYTNGHWVFNSKDVFYVGDMSEYDLVVKTIEQTQANYSADFSSQEILDLNTGITYNPIYARLEQIGNVLYIVNVFELENTTQSTLTIGNARIKVSLPKSIGDKIYDVNGHTLSQDELYSVPISADVGLKGDQSYPLDLNRKVFNVVLKHTDEDELTLCFFELTSINAGQTQLCSFRTFLTLL